VNVRRLLDEAAAELGTSPDPVDPRREARFLLARLLARPEPWLLAHSDAEVGEELHATYTGWVSRRRDGEPAHYIVGSCPFWGREMLVTPAVLIPRPETELIVARALALAGRSAPRVVDVGTGSGCLAVTLALELAGASVTATDVSPAALAVARRNAVRHGARVTLSCGDLAAHLTGPFDLVVANLPYIGDGAIATLPRDVRDFEPLAALAGGPDGACLLRRLVADLPRLLAEGGVALLEVGPGHTRLLAADIATARLVAEAPIVDAGGVQRVLELGRHGAGLEGVERTPA
jgi:release factor glutamine methyltransferase